MSQRGRGKSFLRLIPLVLAFLATACDIPRRPLPQEIYLSRISLQEPRPGQCACSFVPGVSAAYIVNQSDRPIYATAQISSYHYPDGGLIDSRPDRGPVLNPGQGRFLACSITLDEGVAEATASAATCAVRNRFSRVSEYYADRAFVPTGLPALAEEDLAGPAFCQRECREGTPNCLQLNREYGVITSLLRTLVEQADTQGTATISHAKLLETYGLEEEDDQCQRGGISVTPTHVTNEAPEECTIRSAAAAALFARNTSLESRLGLLNASTDVSLRVPQTVRMSKAQPNLFEEGARTLGIFEDLTQSFFIGMRSPHLGFATKAEIDEQRSRFEGHLRDASEITYGDGDRAIVLSTSRGCLMFDAPRS